MTTPAGRRPASEQAGRHWARLLGRGLTKRCPRCGGRRIYDSWFRMKDRCPTCGMRFEREPGFFVGAYLINFAIVIVALFVLCMAFVAVQAADADAGYVGFLVAGFAIAVVLPVLCYPFSRTIWSAIDIGMTPLEPIEEAEAATAVAAAGSPTTPPADDPPPTASTG